MHKTTALFLALAAATSCKPETVTLGVKEHDDKTQAASHDTHSVPVAPQEANHDTELIVIQSAGRPTSTLKEPIALEETKRPGRPTTTHNTPSAPVAHQGAATPEIKSLSITHDKEPLRRATKNRNILKTLSSATQVALTSTQAALMCASEEIEQLANAQDELKRTSEERDKIIQALKEELANVQNMGYNAQTALQSAARQGDIAKLKELLNKPGIDVDTLNTIGKTPLHYAKDAATVQLLLAHGATVHALDNNEHTPLYEAALAGRHDAVLALINAGANAQVALKRAAKDGYTRALQALLNAGADARGVLYEAVQRKQIIAVQTLLKAGVNVQAILQRAAREEDVILLEACSSVGNAVEEKEGQPPWPAYAKAALELIRWKVNIHAKDKEGNTPLHRAARAGNTATVWALIAKGADINAKGQYDYTPLHRAAYQGRVAVATLLIAKGAQVNAKEECSCTPLHCAAYHGNEAVVTLLIANGAKATVNAKDIYGDTPLNCAAQNGHIDVAKLLIANGADINAKNDSGKTPLGAVYYGDKEAMRALLCKHGGHE